MKIEDILEQRERMRNAIEKIMEIKKQADWGNLITDDDFVFTKDTSEALLNENYCFSLDPFAPMTKIQDIEDGKVGPRWFESMITNGMVPNYNGVVRTKCNYDENFKSNMKSNQIENIMYDSDVNFGFGDGIIEEFNLGNFQFFMKIRPEAPFASDISLQDNLIRFNDVDLLMKAEHYENVKNDIIVNIYCPTIIDRGQQFNKWIKEGKV